MNAIPSAGDIVKAGFKLKKVWDAFRDKDGGRAQEQIRNFVELVNTFYICIENVGAFLDRDNRHYPGTASVLDTIEQCERLARKVDAHLRNDKGAAKRAFETTRWALQLEEEKDVLMHRLSQHMQAMSTYVLVRCLDIATHDKQSIHVSSSPAVCASHTTNELQERQIKLFERAILVQNDKKRAPQRDIGPKLREIVKEWREILKASGIPESRIQTIEEDEDQTTIDTSVEHWKRALNAGFRPDFEPLPSPALPSRQSSTRLSRSPNSPASPYTAGGAVSPSISPPHRPRTSTRSSFSSVTDGTSMTIASPGPSLHDSVMDDNDLALPPAIMDNEEGPGFYEIAATVKIGSQEIRVDGLGLALTASRRTLQWRSCNAVCLEHTLSSRHPYTKHSKVGNATEVVFLGGQETRLKGSKRPHTPRYIFADDDTSKNFQSIVRGRDLIETFEVNKVISAISKQGEADHQILQLWQSQTDDRFYLSYFANTLAQPAFREVPITWFSRFDPKSAKNAKSKFQVRLDILKPQDEAVPEKKRRSSSIFTRSNTGLQSSNESQKSRAPSITSIRSDLVDISMPSADASKLEYLAITFSTIDDREAFDRTFVEAQHAMNSSAIEFHARRTLTVSSVLTMRPA